MLDWLIVGGGIHGTHLSFALTRRYGVARDRLRVLDPYEQPLARWQAMTANTGMTHLRSPHVQNLDTDPWSIITFARTRRGEPLAEFIPAHSRPSLALFRAHCDWLIERHDLADLRLVGRATGVTRRPSGWRVTTQSGDIDAHNIILAISATEQPHYPDWAKPYRTTVSPLSHVFAPEFARDDLPEWQHAVVIGGGISAVQTALALAETQPGSVTLIMRHDLRVHDFDSDICWIKASCTRLFAQEPDPDQRRALIQQARHRGSVPPDVAARLAHARHAGHLQVMQGDITRADQPTPHTLTLHLTDGTAITSDRVMLATGFTRRRPGGPWLDDFISAADLPVAACGYPLVDPALCWQRGLYVTGALAELEIGPTARNIIGARFAGERIGAAALSAR